MAHHLRLEEAKSYRRCWLREHPVAGSLARWDGTDDHQPRSVPQPLCRALLGFVRSACSESSALPGASEEWQNEPAKDRQLCAREAAQVLVARADLGADAAGFSREFATENLASDHLRLDQAGRSSTTVGVLFATISPPAASPSQPAASQSQPQTAAGRDQSPQALRRVGRRHHRRSPSCRASAREPRRTTQRLSRTSLG